MTLARRTLLTASAALLGAACTGSEQARPSPSASPDPDALALTAAIQREHQLISVVLAAMQTDPRSTTLAEAMLRHEVHLARLVETAAVSPSPGTTAPTGSPSPTAGGSPSAAPVPAVAAAETAAAAAGLRAVATVRDPSLAVLIASIAASESGGAVVDRGAAR